LPEFHDPERPRRCLPATRIGHRAPDQPFELEGLEQRNRQVREPCTFIEESIQTKPTPQPYPSSTQTGSKLKPTPSFHFLGPRVEIPDPESVDRSDPLSRPLGSSRRPPAPPKSGIAWLGSRHPL
jgi:hypothetical protein